jgi:hypothetical protein
MLINAVAAGRWLRPSLSVHTPLIGRRSAWLFGLHALNA